MKKVTIYVLPLIIFLSGVFYSCNGFEDQDLEIQPTGLTEEAQQLKELYQTEFLKISELKESRSISEMTEDEIKEFFATFSEPTVRMLRSYGFTDKDWKEFEDTSNPAFIVSGMLFLAAFDSSTDVKFFPFVKSRTVENNEGSDTCATLERIALCLGSAALGKEIMTILSGEFIGITCITKALFWATVKKVITNINLWFYLISFSVEFALCVGWV